MGEDYEDIEEQSRISKFCKSRPVCYFVGGGLIIAGLGCTFNKSQEDGEPDNNMSEPESLMDTDNSVLSDKPSSIIQPYNAITQMSKQDGNFNIYSIEQNGLKNNEKFVDLNKTDYLNNFDRKTGVLKLNNEYVVQADHLISGLGDKLTKEYVEQIALAKVIAENKNRPFIINKIDDGYTVLFYPKADDDSTYFVRVTATHDENVADRKLCPIIIDKTDGSVRRNNKRIRNPENYLCLKVPPAYAGLPDLVEAKSKAYSWKGPTVFNVSGNIDDARSLVNHDVLKDTFSRTDKEMKYTYMSVDNKTQIISTQPIGNLSDKWSLRHNVSVSGTGDKFSDESDSTIDDNTTLFDKMHTVSITAMDPIQKVDDHENWDQYRVKISSGSDEKIVTTNIIEAIKMNPNGYISINKSGGQMMFTAMNTETKKYYDDILNNRIPFGDILLPDSNVGYTSFEKRYSDNPKLVDLVFNKDGSKKVGFLLDDKYYNIPKAGVRVLGDISVMNKYMDFLNKVDLEEPYIVTEIFGNNNIDLAGVASEWNNSIRTLERGNNLYIGTGEDSNDVKKNLKRVVSSSINKSYSSNDE